MTVRFDASLPTLTKVLIEQLGHRAVTTGVVLRDASGRLAFFSAEPIEPQLMQHTAERLLRELAPYARNDRVLVSSEDFGAQRVLQDPGSLVVTVNGVMIRLLDRRLAGADWLRLPTPRAPPPPRFVFASLKGGVGRSTALSVAAAAMAGRGRRVLAIDLDMEAPGLGSMLLDDETLPEFGVVDALVENGLTPLDDAFLADLVGPSKLAGNHGRIDVVPAFGRCSLSHPADVLAKLARAYVEDVHADGTVATVLDQIRGLVDSLSAASRYDAVLVDARAGLHETSAAALLGLGANVFLFGLDEPQTFQGYQFLLAHLARLKGTAVSPEWLERLTMVQGKAPLDEAQRAGFADRCRLLFERSGLLRVEPAVSEVRLPAEPFSNVPWEDTDDLTDDELLPWDDLGDRTTLAILHDPRYANFVPSLRRDLLHDAVYRTTFGAFIDRINEELRT